MQSSHEWYALRQIVLEVCEKIGIQVTPSMTYFEAFELVVAKMCSELVNMLIATVQSSYPYEGETKERHLSILKKKQVYIA